MWYRINQSGTMIINSETKEIVIAHTIGIDGAELEFYNPTVHSVTA